MSAFSDSVDAATKGFLGRKLWVVLVTLTSAREALAPYLAEHIEVMLKLEEEGAVIGAGPFLDDAGQNSGNGMFILAAPDLAAAHALVARDPFAREGLRRYEIRPWIMNLGRASVSMRFSDQSAKLL